MDLAPWIADYAAFLKSNGYVPKTVDLRVKHLSCLNRFIQARGFNPLEPFGPELSDDFIDYWIDHQLKSQKRPGFRCQARSEPHQHKDVQFTLRSFFRWAHTAGHLQQNPFPLRPPLRRDYFFPETRDYLHFCREHKGLAENSCRQVELFVRRFDQFLRSAGLTSWDRLEHSHIDRFVSQQASHNIPRIQLIHSLLRGLLRYLFSLGRLERDWASTLRSPRQYSLAHAPRTATVDQLLHLLRSIDCSHRGGKRDLAIILMAAGLGVRASEIAALSLDDLDWTQTVVSFPAIKNQDVLPLPLPRPLIEALADYLKNERPAGSPYRNVFLRLIPPLGPLTASAVSKLMSQRMRRAGIRASGHGLRHTFASELLKSGVSFSTLQELLGHRAWSSTQIYTKIDLVQLREVANNDAETM